MTEQETKSTGNKSGSIDYNASQKEIELAKQKAHDDDAKRLEAEHE